MIRVGNFMILVLYVNNILLTNNEVNMLIKTKQMLLKHFEMKNLRNASFILGIEIHYDRYIVILDLSQ